MADAFELRRLRLTEDLRARLSAVRESRKIAHAGLRAALELFGATEGAIATLDPARSGAETIYLTPAGSKWDERLLADYLLGKRPPIPEHTLLAPVVRRERNWAVLAVRAGGGRSFADEELRAFFALAAVVTESLARLDELRTRDVRLKIERKIAERRVPKDLMYDILHGLRSLTGYNHSASLWIAKAESGPLELVAEQIAWTKARSKRIGIFLSIFDVHTNRAPVSGRIAFQQHRKGFFFDARRPECSEKNEAMTWAFQNPRATIVVRQLTGAIARRIVGWAKVGDELKRGQRFGMIRFGSRTEVYLPLDAEILVKVGDHVKGGASVIARLPE